MKNYIGISRDHSGSMRSIARPAARDYNSKIASIRDASITHNQDTVVSVVECGYGDTDRVRRVVINSAVAALQPINESLYQADGRGTPLWDSVGELIEMFESVPDAASKEVSFLVMAITDGAENASRKYSPSSLAAKIRQLESTDRWTFVFRVPRGHGREIARKLGISEGNIQEWDQTEKGVQVAAKRDEEAFTQYFTSRSLGATSTKKFYADLSSVTSKDVAVALTDISAEVSLWPVSATDDGAEIRTFVEKRLNGEPLLKGAAFYQLTKTEPEVQDHKRIIIRDKTTNAVYEGAAARQMLGLPTYGTIRLAPGNFGNFDLFIQSTSVNRKMTKGTNVVYWKNVGKAYKEGPSARR
jgi:hypothetical protein